MRVFDVMDRISGPGEKLLGADATGSHACYLIYGVLGPGEAGRELRPGRGHEEIVLAVRGDLRLTGSVAVTVKQGQAVHLLGGESCLAANPSAEDVVYVIAGGHSPNGHHH
jgi:hypothetical protein